MLFILDKSNQKIRFKKTNAVKRKKVSVKSRKRLFACIWPEK